MMFWCGQVMLMGGVLLFHLRMRKEKKSLVTGHLSVVAEERKVANVTLARN
jgi:hypothetical protein